MPLKTLAASFITFILGTAMVLFATTQKITSKPTVSPTHSPSPTTIPTSTPTLIDPIADFRHRVTKKFFGTYVSPGHSPVSPERFTGYHTGVDVEYNDQKGDIPAVSIADGTVIYSGYVNGYGGFVAVQYTINTSQYIGTYGHLNPQSLIASNQKVNLGQTIGLLGLAYSTQTAGERRHLHFGLIKGNTLDFRGYVTDSSKLSTWVNPLDILP